MRLKIQLIHVSCNILKQKQVLTLAVKIQLTTFVKLVTSKLKKRKKKNKKKLEKKLWKENYEN